MKKNGKVLTLILAVMLLCTACEERRVIDISDGGEMLGSGAPVSVPGSEEKPAQTQETAAEDTAAAEPESEQETAAGVTSDGNIALEKMAMKANTKGMCLVPTVDGAVFVVNKVQLGTCTITTDPKNFIGADCTLKAASGAEADVRFVLMQGGREVISAAAKVTFNEGENTIQVLIRLTDTASGEYTGKLYIGGELIGESSVTA